MELLVSILVPLGMMAMVVLIVWLNLSSKRHARERQAEVTAKLIDSFSTGEAFAQALRGPEGSKLAESLALEGSKEPKHAWVGLSIPALILSFLGIAFLVLAAFEHRAFVIPGVLVGAVGAGLLLSAYLAWRAERRSNGESADDSQARSTDGSGDSDLHPF